MSAYVPLSNLQFSTPTVTDPVHFDPIQERATSVIASEVEKQRLHRTASVPHSSVIAGPVEIGIFNLGVSTRNILPTN